VTGDSVSDDVDEIAGGTYTRQSSPDLLLAKQEFVDELVPTQASRSSSHAGHSGGNRPGS